MKIIRQHTDKLSEILPIRCIRETRTEWRRNQVDEKENKTELRINACVMIFDGRSTPAASAQCGKRNISCFQHHPNVLLVRIRGCIHIYFLFHFLFSISSSI